MEIQNFIKIYEKSFADNWDFPAVSDYGGKTSLSYGDLAKEIEMTHLLFEAIGLKEGEKIALCGKDSVNWIIIYMATVTYGAVIVPILSEFNPLDIAHIINHSDATLLFVSQPVWDNLNPESLLRVKGVFSLADKSVLLDKDIPELHRHIRLLKRRFNRKFHDGFNPSCIKYSSRKNSELVELNYTSGTTGFSKGVMLSGENLSGNVCFGIESKLHFKGSRALSFLPLAHAYGCAFDMLTPLAVGSHVTVLGKIPAPRILLKAFADVKPNLVICVPLVLEKIYKSLILPMISRGAMKWTLAIPFLDNLIHSKIRNKLIEAFGGEFEEVIVGGAPLNHEVEEFLHRIKFPFTVGYGMTECGPLISYTPWKEFIVGSSGKTLPVMESKINSDDPESIAGEICVRGVNRMIGYYKNRKATQQIIDKDGWLHTGDLGTRSHDGTLFLRGRSKTMILSASGQNIYPEEIESKLNNMPFVAESLVIEKNGKLIGLIYPDFETADKLGVSLPELEEKIEVILSDINKSVAPYERLSEIKLMPNEFEKTPKRSIKRFLYS